MPFSTGHLWLIVLLLIVVLIIWGPSKLPDIGSGMGRAIREFKKAASETADTVHKAASADGGSDSTRPSSGAGDPPRQPGDDVR